MTVLFSNNTATLSHTILSSYFSDNNKDHGCRIRCNQLQKKRLVDFQRTHVSSVEHRSQQRTLHQRRIWKKIQSLFAACSERKVEVGLRLLAKQSSILDGSVTILYHRHCRSTYTSKLHLKRNADKQVKTGETQSSSCEYNRMTRSSLHLNTFDWKKNCFHCGAECQSMSVNGAVSHWEEVRQVWHVLNGSGSSRTAQGYRDVDQTPWCAKWWSCCHWI